MRTRQQRQQAKFDVLAHQRARLHVAAARNAAEHIHRGRLRPANKVDRAESKTFLKQTRSEVRTKICGNVSASSKCTSK